MLGLPKLLSQRVDSLTSMLLSKFELVAVGS